MTAGRLTMIAAIAASLSMTQAAWQPSPGHTQLPIWPGAAPDARPVEGPEVSGTVVDAAGQARLVGGKPWVYVDKVSQPTMTVYSPRGRNTGAAVVVFPGGGYNVLAIDLEGTEVCDWLTSKGITCVLLKSRALRKAGIPAEMHVYVKGGHAFGLRPIESPITRWPPLVETWLASIGMI